MSFHHRQVALDVWYAAVQFTALENMRVLAVRLSPEQRRDPLQLSTGENAAIGFSTGVVAAVMTEPLDVVRTRLMTQGERGQGAFGYTSLTDGLRKAARSEGVLALWKVRKPSRPQFAASALPFLRAPCFDLSLCYVH